MTETLGLCLMSVFVLAGLVTEIGCRAASRPILTGPTMAYLKSVVEFRCEVQGPPLPSSYELLRDGKDLVATSNDPEGRLNFTEFRLKVKDSSEGAYHCRATAAGQTSISNTVHLQVVIPVSGTSLLSVPDPPVINEGAGLTLRCQVQKGTHLSYTWYHNRQEVTSPSPLHRLSGKTLTVDRVTERHAGSYSCMVNNKMEVNAHFSSSSEVYVTVKANLSAPRISFTLYREASGYRANVSCRSARGSPPVTFRLLLDGRELGAQETAALAAWFSVPISVGRRMGAARCQAEAGTQTLLGDPVDLEVAPVGGVVRVQVEYLYRADSKLAAAQLRCDVSRGTFPSFSWLFDRALLPAEGHAHALAQHGRILFLTDLTPGNSGYYHCRVRDSFDANASWVESGEVFVHVTEGGVVSIEVIAMAFFCFLMLVILGSVGCILKKFDRGVYNSVQPNADALALSVITSGSEVETTNVEDAPWHEETTVALFS